MDLPGCGARKTKRDNNRKPHENAKAVLLNTRPRVRFDFINIFQYVFVHLSYNTCRSHRFENGLQREREYY